jgi:2-phosphosulfolactate phosphatase
MRIDVAFTSSEAQALFNKVCVVIDVVRATSSLAVIMSKGPSKVTLTTTVQKATKLAEQQTVHPLLCGERGGVAPTGFNYGNSPAEYFNANLAGKEIIFTSSNGSRAIADLLIAPHLYLGSFLNAAAVTKKVYEVAKEEDLDVLFVCAGREEKFAIDDAYCAGYLISQLVSLIPATEEFELADGAQAALGICGYYRDTKRLFEMSGAGKAVIDIGLEDDLSFLLQKDLLDNVPELIQKNNKQKENGFYVVV